MNLWAEHKFAAFVSYSTLDGQMGGRFQKALERYKLPKPLRGRLTALGPVPRRLSPIFRDRSDLSAGRDLARMIEDGLRDSAWLIVLCSPRSAASRWVNAEITKFLEWERGDRIVAVLIDGKPSAYDSEQNPEGAFPPALVRPYRTARGNMEHPPEPFTPDLREPDATGAGGDGFDLALLKVVARMTGLPLIEVTQRQGEADRAEKRLYLSLTVAGLGLASAALLAAWFAVLQRNEALRRESAIFAERASELTESYWPDRAIYTVLHGLPAGEGLIPWLARPMESTALARLSEALSRFGGRRRVFVRSGAVDIDEARILSDEKTVLVRCKEYVGKYDLGTGQMQVLMKTGSRAMAVFPDEESILVASDPGTVFRISLENGTAIPLFQVEGVWSLDISPAGDRIVTGLYDHNAHVWDAASGKEVHVLRGHETSVAKAKFSPNGESILTIAADRTARLWDANTGAAHSVLSAGEHLFRSGEFSKDGTLIATPASSGNILIWKAANGGLVTTLVGHTGDMEAVSFSPDGSRLASASHDETVRVWDVATGQEIANHPSGAYPRSVSFSPDGRRVIDASDGGKICVYDVVDGTKLDEFNTIPDFYTKSFTRAAYSPKGGHILSVSSYDVQLLDPGSSAVRYTLRADSGPATAVAFSPDGKTLVTGYEDFNAILWDPSSGTKVRELGSEAGSIYSIQFTKSGEYFATGSWDRRVRVWHTATGALKSTLGNDENSVSKFTISSDGRWIATADSAVVQVWELLSGKMMATLRGHTGEVEGLAFSADSTRLVSASVDGTAKIWDWGTKVELQSLADPGKRFRSVAFAPSDDRVVTGGYDGNARIWHAKSGRELHLLAGHTTQIHRIVFSPDEQKILTMSYDGTARLWEAKHGRSLGELRAQGGEIVVGGFSADGTRIVTAAQFGNGIAQVWDALSCAPITRLRGHSAAVDDAAFSPDGRLIASASTDGTIRVWNAPQGTAQPTELLTQACASLHRYQRTFDQEEVANLRLPPSLEGEGPCEQVGILSSKWWAKRLPRFGR